MIAPRAPVPLSHGQNKALSAGAGLSVAQRRRDDLDPLLDRTGLLVTVTRVGDFADIPGTEYPKPIP